LAARKTARYVALLTAVEQGDESAARRAMQEILSMDAPE
jgi:DNA-binding FadR family transcriptional regulator